MKIKHPYNFVDLSGQRFGKLLVINYLYSDKRGQSCWLCKCDCGKMPTKNVTTNQLKSGKRISCGCLRGGAYQTGLAAFNKLYSSYECKAKMRNMEFNLSLEEFKNLINNNCFYCNDEPYQICNTGRNTGGYIYNGIDRINNNIGYTIANSVSCCGLCNRYKSNNTEKVFLSHIEKIYNYRIKNNV